MKNTVENQLKDRFPLRSIEELNAIKTNIDLNFLTEKSEGRSKIMTTARQEFELVETIYNEFLTLIHTYGFEVNKNSEVVSSLGLNRPAYPEIAHYLAPVLPEFNNQNCYIKNDLQEIYNNLHAAYCELRHQAYAYEKGEKGEEYVKSETALLSTKCKSLYNVRIPSAFQSNSSELDCVFATSKGIIVAEVKTLGSELDQFVVSQDGLWTKIRNGHEEVLNCSPSRQNMIHCLAVEKFFKEHGISQVKVIPVILWASKAKINNNSYATIIRPEMLYDYIEKIPLPEKYDDEFQTKIINLLEKNDLGDNTFTIKAYNQENNTLDVTNELLQFMANNYNAAKNALEYKIEYPLSKSIWNTLGTVIFIIVVITLLIVFAKQLFVIIGTILLIYIAILGFEILLGL